MKISSFKYFLAVVDKGSIRQAADDLHISASAISRQINKLEYYFKATLFDRRSSGMSLTAEGRIVERHMRRTVREMDLAQTKIDESHNLLTGTVAFATIEGVVNSWLLPAITQFQVDYPAVRFSASVVASDSAVNALINDQVDFAIALQGESHPEIEIIERFETGFKVAIAHNHRLAGRATVALDELSAYPLAMLCERFHTRQLLKVAALRRSLNFKISFESDQIEMIKRFIIATNGVTILPSYAVMNEQQMTIADIEQDELTKATTVLCIRRDRHLTSAAIRFIDLVRLSSNCYAIQI